MLLYKSSLSPFHRRAGGILNMFKPPILFTGFINPVVHVFRGDIVRLFLSAHRSRSPVPGPAGTRQALSHIPECAVLPGI